MKTKQAVLCINTWNSYCRNCGKDCKLEEKIHKTNLGWSPEGEGCGIEYKGVTSDYDGLSMEESTKKLRPDLQWVEIGDTQSFKI